MPSDHNIFRRLCVNQLCNLSDSFGKAFLQVEFVTRVRNGMAFGGFSLDKFKPWLLSGKRKTDGQIFFNKNNSIDGITLYDFVAAFSGNLGTHLLLNWGDSGRPKYLQLDCGAATSGSGKRLAPFFWKLLESCGKRNASLTDILFWAPADTFDSFSEDIVPEDERELFSQLKLLLPRLHDDGRQAKIEKLALNEVTCDFQGWQGHASIWLNGIRVVPEIISDGLQIRAARIPIDTERCSASDYLIELRDNENGKVLDFKFFSRPHDYTGKLENFFPLLSGWAIDRSRKADIFEISISIDGEMFGKSRNGIFRQDLLAKLLSTGHGGFAIESPRPWLWPGGHKLQLNFPDGSCLELPELDGRSSGPKPIYGYAQARKEVEIIIPIHNAPEDLRICLSRIIEFTPPNAGIILVDDCSTDPDIEKILEEYGNLARVKIIRNKTNLGFSGSVNAGIEVAGKKDVIILNSDARVTPRWLESLLLAAASQDRVATVTPLSDRAGAFSVPEQGNDNPLPENADEIEYAIALRRSSLGVLPQVPTGNGFCMFISRSAIDEVGLFDAEAFPRGYGEENDFCMRAVRKGWANLIDDRTIVFHESGQSFQKERNMLMVAGRKKLSERYPEYTPAISIFSQGAKMNLARWGARKARRNWRELNNVRILIVIAARTGGTKTSTDDLLVELDKHCECFLMHCDGKCMTLEKYASGQMELLFRHELKRPIEPVGHVSSEYDAVAAGWIFALDIDAIHIQHLLRQSLNLVSVARLLNRVVTFSFHDFYSASPDHTLTDSTGVFLGRDYAPQAPSYPDLLPVQLPIDDDGYLQYWRKRSESVLAEADAYFFFSVQGKTRAASLMKNLDMAKAVIIPHGRSFARFYQLKAEIIPDRPIRLLVPGNINYNKGLGIIRALADYDQCHARKLEFHFIGACQDCSFPRARGYGNYRQEDLPRVVSGIGPHAGIVFSICEETWCHTLTEMWALGIPVLAFDLGTIGARLKRSGAGWALQQMDIPELYKELLGIMRDPLSQAGALAATILWQENEGREETREKMGERYWRVYQGLLKEKRTENR